jgi:hypothetical protein
MKIVFSLYETGPCVVEYSVNLLRCGLACYGGSFYCCPGAWFGVAIVRLIYVWSGDVPDLVFKNMYNLPA